MRYVDQATAKKGTCIDTYDTKNACLTAGSRMERLLKRQGNNGEIVYTFIWGQKGKQDGTWQIYLIQGKG